MSNTKKCPCRKCIWHICEGMECEKFQKWFMKAWKEINNFAWHAMDFQGTLDHFKYELPHERPVMDKDPCLDCICREWCDTPCRKRLKWWDIKMAELRSQLHYAGEEVKTDE